MNLPPAPPNFRPLDRNRPIHMYKRNLPHWRQEGATYFITIHTRDSLPACALRDLKEIRERWLKENPPPHDDECLQELNRLSTKRTEEWLHRGKGACPFQHHEHRECLYNALLHFHGSDRAKDAKGAKAKRVELGAFVIMPNHMHIAARPLTGIKLENWTGSVKQFVAKRTPASFKFDGCLWSKESHDRIVRDLKHLNNGVRYIGRNPSMSRISAGASHTLWLNPDWRALGWSLGST